MLLNCSGKNKHNNTSFATVTAATTTAINIVSQHLTIEVSPDDAPAPPRAIAFAASAPNARILAACIALSLATLDVVQISGAQKHQVPSGCVNWFLQSSKKQVNKQQCEDL